jgi:glucosamine--fructose-6-phosphate aminotransferase (isomerizing)
VLCQKGENRFDGVAEQVIALPRVGAGLDFVLATVVGHLLGIAAARNIDKTAVFFRDARALVSDSALASSREWDRRALLEILQKASETLDGELADTALSASLAVRFERYHQWFRAQPESLPASEARLDEALGILNRIVDDLTRPIDTIRHQAKTVTVGISRPQDEVSPLLLDLLDSFGFSERHMGAADRERLVALSPVVTNLSGGLLYEVTKANDSEQRDATWKIQAVKGYGESRPELSRFCLPREAVGSKRTVLRKGVSVCSASNESSIFVPVYAGHGTAITHIVLLHLDIAQQSSLQQKTTILGAFGEKLEELRDRLAEADGEKDFDALLADVPLTTLVFQSVDRILDQGLASK